TTAWPVLDALRISPSGSSTLIEDRRPKIEDSRSGNAVPGIGTGGLRGPNRHRGLARAWGLLDDASLRGEVPDAAPRPGSPLGAAPHRSGPGVLRRRGGDARALHRRERRHRHRHRGRAAPRPALPRSVAAGLDLVHPDRSRPRLLLAPQLRGPARADDTA